MIVMNNSANKSLTPISKVLRKNMTKEERKLWYECLKLLPVTANRQKVIGQYIVDFYIASAKLVIELDGSQHYKTNDKIADTKRDNFLQTNGYTVVRYSNYDINRNFIGVCEDIYNRLGLCFSR